MQALTLFGIAIGLSMDAFVVATACSVTLRRVTGRQIFRFAFHFGLFQAMMPVIGWLIGLTAYGLIARWDHWIAFGLLSFVGVHAIIDAISTTGEDDKAEEKDPTRGLSLVMLSIATSIDALAVGISLAMLQVRIWTAALLIGLTTGLLTSFGMRMGARIGAGSRKGLGVLGGVVLIGIGLKILLSDLLGEASP